MGHFIPARVRCGGEDDWPVAAPHGARGAERLEHGLDEGAQIARRGARPGFGEQTAQLDEGAALRERLQTAQPWAGFRPVAPLGDGGLREVIDHHAEGGMAIHEPRDRAELVRADERVEADALRRDRREGRLAARVEDPPVVGDVLQHRAHAHERPVSAQPREVVDRRRRPQVDPADHALDPCMLPRQAQQEEGLLDALGRLHRDAAADAACEQLRPELVGFEVVPERRHGGREPVVVAPRTAPEMLVAVDAPVRHDAAPGSAGSGVPP